MQHSAPFLSVHGGTLMPRSGHDLHTSAQQGAHIPDPLNAFSLKCAALEECQQSFQHLTDPRVEIHDAVYFTTSAGQRRVMHTGCRQPCFWAWAIGYILSMKALFPSAAQPSQHNPDERDRNPTYGDI